MRNFEKYKTAKEKAEAFDAFCNSHSSKCDLCPLNKECDDGSQTFAWLELEAEKEKPLPCPFCGGECECEDVTNHTPIDKEMYSVYCLAHSCMYQSKMYKTESEAIAAHNRVARAVMAAKDKEAK